MLATQANAPFAFLRRESLAFTKATRPSRSTHPSFENTCVKSPGVALGYANAQPPGCDKIATAPPGD